MYFSTFPVSFYLLILLSALLHVYSSKLCQVGGTDAGEAGREKTARARRRVGEGEIEAKTGARAAADPPEDAGRRDEENCRSAQEREDGGQTGQVSHWLLNLLF